MVNDITAFGYVIPVIVIVVFVVLVLGLALAVTLYLTIGWSVYRSVVRTQRQSVEDDVRSSILDRLFSDEPDWESWIDTLSDTERAVAENILDELLRELEGSDAATLRKLGVALGIPKRSGKRLRSGSEYTRLHALTWLTLLRTPEPYLESPFEPSTPRERAVTATLLYETEQYESTDALVSLLVDGTDTQFTVLGQHTLYRISRTNPTPLLQTAARRYQEWPEPLLAQVLSVCANLETSVSDEDLAWLTAALEDQNDAIRAASARTLGSFGWQESLRDQVFLERATDDPIPSVRGAVYEMLADWGDEEAISILLYALVTETDPAALVRGTDALVDSADGLDPEVPAVLGPAWEWSYEHAQYDRIAIRGPRAVEE